MSRIYFPLLLFTVLVHVSCSPAVNALSLAIQVAEEKFDGVVEYISNRDSSFVICSNRPKPLPGHPLQPLRFIVFDTDRDMVVFEDSLESANVYWLTDTRFQVQFIPEVISGDEEAEGYVYDLVTQKKYPFLKKTLESNP